MNQAANARRVRDGSVPSWRIPDFLIIGAMKSGTTSLYRWLGDRDDVFVPSKKEPNFFSDDRVWSRGLSWYGSLFDGAGPVRAAGEASVSYTDPDRAGKAAGRIAEALPEVRMVYVVRDPIERMRSHYRHEVQRGRERRPFATALADSAVPYAAWSRYHACLHPYLQLFPRERLLVVPFEGLMREPRPGWASLLHHLALPYRPAPGTPANVTADKRGFNRVGRRLWDTGLLARAQRLPGSIRRIGRPFLFSGGTRYRDLLATSRGPIPTAITNMLADDTEMLAGALGWPKPPWGIVRS